MSRKKIVVRLDKKDDLDPSQDQFINRTMTVFEWAGLHRRPLMLGAGIVVMAAVIGVVIGEVSKGSHEDASASLFAGTRTALAMIPEGEAAKDLPNWVQTFPSLTARQQAATAAFQKTIADEGARYAAAAELGLASTLLAQGKVSEAKSHFEKFLGASDGEFPWLEPLAIEGLGYALEAEGKLDEAKTRFLELAKGGDERLALTAELQVARLNEKKGDKPGALAAYRKVVDKVAANPVRDRFDWLFAEARSRLLALDPQATVPPLPRGFDFGNIDPQLLQQLLRARAGQGAAN